MRCIHGESGWRGKSMSPEYRAWSKMKRRALNPEVKDRPYYGDGVGMDPRWNSYLMFLADMDRRPSPRHSLDRRDANNGYWPGNCRWATPTEQRNNTCGARAPVPLIKAPEPVVSPKRRCKHGHSISSNGRPSPEYRSWAAMRGRCKYPCVHDYARYGGRGIKVCERWNSFELFLEDMGSKPAPNYWIGRRDADGHYEPGNCVWQSPAEQRRSPASVHVPEMVSE